MTSDELSVTFKVDPQLWDSEVSRLGGNALHSYIWSRYSGENNNAKPVYFFLKNRSGENIAVSFGLYSEKKAGIRIYSSLYVGSLAAGAPEYRKEMARAILSYCRKKRIVTLSMNSFGTPDAGEIIPEIGLHSSRRWEFVLDISGAEKDVWDKIHSKKRNLIRKGQKEGLNVVNENAKESVMLFRDLAMETYLRKTSLGISYPKPAATDIYEKMYDRLMSNSIGKLYLAYKDTKVAAGAFFVSFNGQVYYMLSSSSDEGLKMAAPDLILWTAITDFQKDGCSVFNFGGLSESELDGQPLEKSGLYHFKQRFSPEILPCFKGSIVLKPLQYRTYSLMKNAKSLAGKLLKRNS